MVRELRATLCVEFRKLKTREDSFKLLFYTYLKGYHVGKELNLFLVTSRANSGSKDLSCTYKNENFITIGGSTL